MKKFLLLTFIAGTSHLLSAQSGTLDPTFGNKGVVVTQADSSGKYQLEGVEKAFQLPGGKFITVIQKEGKVLLIRRLADGSRDAGFGFDGYSRILTMSYVSAVMQTDGKVLVMGYSGSNACFMARYNLDGILDASFGNQGVVTTGFGLELFTLSEILVTPGGKIIVGGTAVVGGVEQFLLAGFNSEGSPDLNFGNNGLVIGVSGQPETLYSLALQADGKILAAGVASGTVIIARFTTNGDPDLDFNGTGYNLTSEAPGQKVLLAIAPDGKIYTAASYASSEPMEYGVNVTRFNANGLADLSYNNGSPTITVLKTEWYRPTEVIDIAVQTDGKLLAIGDWFEESPPVLIYWVFRLNPDGQPDASFGRDGVTVPNRDGWIESEEFINVLPGGQILTGGYQRSHPFADKANYSSLYLLNSDGSRNPSFGTDGQVLDYVPSSQYTHQSAALQSDGKLMVTSTARVGYSDEGHPEDFSSYLSRFTTAGNPDGGFGTGGRIKSEQPFDQIGFLLPDSRLYNLEYVYNNEQPPVAIRVLRRYTLDIEPDNSFAGGTGVQLNNEGQTTQLTTYPGGRIVVAELVGRVLWVSRFNNNGTPDAGFGSGGVVTIDLSATPGFPFVHTAAVSPADGKIVIGCNSVLVRLNGNGSIDNAFGTQGKVIISEAPGKLAIRTDKKIVYCYSGVGQNTSFFVTRLNENGSPDLSFGTKPAPGLLLVLQNDNRIISAGTRINLQSDQDFVMMRWNADGSVDGSFGNGGTATASFSMINIYPELLLYSPDRGLYMIGSALNNLGNFVGLIARFRLNTASGNISCPENKTVLTDPGLCTAKINNIDPAISGVKISMIKYKLAGATTGLGTGSVSGKTFNKGVTTVTYTLTNDPTKSCSFTVTVKDKELPVITGLRVSPTTLWPPNHNMVDVVLTYDATDNCDAPRIALGITSNEPVTSRDNGDQSPDWQIIDAHRVRLRAERLGNGNGRVYTIKVFATDLSGNQVVQSVVVTVPKNKPAQVCDLNVQASPNPTNSYFRISLSSSCDEKINLRVVNVKGVVVAVYNNISSAQVIKTGDKLPPGIYFLEATQGTTKKTVKLIKQN